MARKPRFNLPGIPQHVVQRGNNREPCFFAEEDYRFYLECLKESSDKFQCDIHAYVLMTNHVHLLVTPHIDNGISQLMQSVGRKYVRHVNYLYRRTGTLWEGRYKASLVDSQRYLFTCMRYIELNPVRAQMVDHPGEYKWSSYPANGYGKANEYIVQHPLYQELDNDTKTRCAAYREMFRHHMDYQSLHHVREALNQELVLGSSYFKEKIEKIIDRRIVPGKPGRPRIEEEYAGYFVY